MKIGLIQNYVKLGDIDHNKALFFNEISSLLKESPDFIILPEMWLTGFDYENILKFSEYTYSIINELQNLLHDDTMIISSLPEPANPKVYNTIFVFNSSKIVTKYRKNFLFSPLREDNYFQKGDSITLFENKGIKVGLHTCYEIRFPELFRLSTYKGAELFFIPAIWPADKKNHWLTLIKARAIENQAFVIGCNASRINTKKKEITCGYSLIVDPWGNEIFTADDKSLSTTVVIDLSKIKKVRDTIPSLKDAMKAFEINKKP
ncbi:nitrilase-related carbon-nitrogen hydrolase [Deferribacter abyssi]|uniref:nitrilase-related carbon-nitrogen hydrolase n=1 Tax=Deferribacter abyssi TaxID=213806 RepID=UPI003C166747